MSNRKRRAATEVEIRRECERDRRTLWTDARWYEVLSRDEIEKIVMEYGYGPLQPSFPRMPSHEDRWAGRSA